MSFVDLSRFLNEQLQNPIVQADKKLRLWCLSRRATPTSRSIIVLAKRDWLEARKLRKAWARING
jgi:hypothetical protein